MPKKIIVVTRTDINARGGSALHLRNLLDTLGKNGHQIAIANLGSNFYDATPSEEEMSRLKEEVAKHNVDVVIADYSWMCDAFDLFPFNVRKICFVHDLRCRIVPCLEAIGYKDRWSWTEEKEAKLLQKADTLLVLNEDDRIFCARMAPDAKIIRIGIAMEPVPHDPAKEIPGRCIFVGSFSWENQYAISWFQTNVWPLVLKEIPTATLDICMSTVDNLEEHYAQAQLAVVPHVMRGGLKIKCAEAFQHGLLVVGNKCAFDGFESVLSITDDFDNYDKMATSIVDSLRFPLRSLSIEKAHDICLRQMTPQAAYGELLKELE